MIILPPSRPCAGSNPAHVSEMPISSVRLFKKLTILAFWRRPCLSFILGTPHLAAVFRLIFCKALFATIIRSLPYTHSRKSFSSGVQS